MPGYGLPFRGQALHQRSCKAKDLLRGVSEEGNKEPFFVEKKAFRESRSPLYD